jgi:hypothetical protein
MLPDPSESLTKVPMRHDKQDDSTFGSSILFYNGYLARGQQNVSFATVFMVYTIVSFSGAVMARRIVQSASPMYSSLSPWNL